MEHKYGKKERKTAKPMNVSTPMQVLLDMKVRDLVRFAKPEDMAIILNIYQLLNED